MCGAVRCVFIARLGGSSAAHAQQEAPANLEPHSRAPKVAATRAGRNRCPRRTHEKSRRRMQSGRCRNVSSPRRGVGADRVVRRAPSCYWLITITIIIIVMIITIIAMTIMMIVTVNMQLCLGGLMRPAADCAECGAASCGAASASRRSCRRLAEDSHLRPHSSRCVRSGPRLAGRGSPDLACRTRLARLGSPHSPDSPHSPGSPLARPASGRRPQTRQVSPSGARRIAASSATQAGDNRQVDTQLAPMEIRLRAHRSAGMSHK